MAQQARWSDLPTVGAAIADGQVGPVLRAARTAAGWTLEQVAARMQLSASVLSRLECGRRAPRSIAELRRLARAYGVPDDLLGLSATVTAAQPPGMVNLEPAREDGGDRMHRRNLLGGTVAVAAAAALPAGTAAADPLKDVIFGRIAVEPLPPAQLHVQLAAAAADFRACRYQQLARRLPRLVAQATATHAAAASEEQAAAAGDVTRAYGIATQLLIKLHDDGMAWATADRASQAATASDDPLLRAEAARLAATVARRGQRRDSAQRLMLRAAAELSAATGLNRPVEATAYGHLLAAAAYTAAIRDDRDTAWSLLDEAEHAHHRAGSHPSATLATIDLYVYRISVARKLGDYGAAVDYARQVDPSKIKTIERRARYWEDTALALHGRGRPGPAFQALTAAERNAPQEVRYRPWATSLTAELLRQPRHTVPGIEQFAQRVGVR
ncbi:hypothetical protein GCM10010124_04930 [Pilimelia terevasa]|uniref:HTH cro/C1-type domain-containing protein n=1 Tax=Pilimelia terevasa TaxID=53372 RepID=A0A8J3BHI6_9ACTN|nr:helix-turn-helix transcriptional regulator [Pilimelia terevasa]GGK15303.1 hypothetical protein GCM10010124_04930 [Pilimelia terevasa]